MEREIPTSPPDADAKDDGETARSTAPSSPPVHLPVNLPVNLNTELHSESATGGGDTAARDAAWAAGGELMRAIYARGASAVLGPIANLRQAFARGHERITCIDAGVVMAGTGKSILPLAGSGLLFPAESWEERLARVAEICLALGVREVTSHAGCGAAALAYARDGRPAGHAGSDEYGQAWSRALRERIERIGDRLGGARPVAYRHIAASEMARPRAFHDCRVTWLDSTGRFNPGNLSGQIPQGYLVDRADLLRQAATAEERSYPAFELALSIDLALGAAGFGARFTAEEPFVVVAVVDGEEGWQALRAELDGLAARYAGRVRIDRLLVDRFRSGA